MLKRSRQQEFLLDWVFYQRSRAPATSSGNVDALHDGLRALGWLEGKNIITEYRWAQSNYEKLPKLAAELVDLKMDVIVTNASRAAIAAKQATNKIPIVFQVLGDAVAMGLVASLPKPGGNLNGSIRRRSSAERQTSRNNERGHTTADPAGGAFQFHFPRR